MSRTTSDVLVERLIDWGVDVVFGLPGDGINGIMEALRTRQDRISLHPGAARGGRGVHGVRLRQVHRPARRLPRHSGPGAIHLLNGLYDAKMDGAPVLAITGQTYHDLIGTRYQQEVDLLSLFKDVARLQPADPGRRPRARARRCRLPRGAVAARRRAHHLSRSIFRNKRSRTTSRRRRRSRATPRTPGGRRSSCRATTTSARAADVLNAGTKTVILAGQGALGAGDELEQLADLLAAPIVKPLLGKAVVPDDSPFTTGGIGLLGTEPSEVAMEECDTLLMVGTSFPVHGVLSETRRLARRADRPRSVADRPALSGRRRPVRRRAEHAAGC